MNYYESLGIDNNYGEIITITMNCYDLLWLSKNYYGLNIYIYIWINANCD